MYILLIGGALAAVGTWAFSSSAGNALGTAAGNGIGDAAVILSIAAGVGILIYTVHKSGGKRA